MSYDGSRDRYRESTVDVISQARSAAAVVPSDATDFAVYPKALYVGTAGVLVCIPVDNADNESVSFTVPQGPFPVQVRRVLATGTTADNIVALY